MDQKVYDIAIIGAGPVGLFAGFQAGVNELKTIIIDTLDTAGGQCSVLYPEKFIYDVPGHEKITAQDLVDRLNAQCNRFNHDYLFGNQVVDLKKEEEIFTLKTSKGLLIKTRTILICAGNGSFNPNKPDVIGIENFEGKSVLYFIDDIKKFHNKIVAIAGGGDSAVDWAIMLAKHNQAPKKIYFIHRRQEMRCHPNSLAELQSLVGENFQFKIPFVAKELKGINNLESLILKSFCSEETEEIKIDYFLPFFGLKGDIEGIKNFGINFNKSKIPVDYSNMSTNLEGIYAAGDICEYKGKTKLLVTGFHEAAVACNGISDYLSEKFHKEKKVFEYSTTKLKT